MTKLSELEAEHAEAVAAVTAAKERLDAAREAQDAALRAGGDEGDAARIRSRGAVMAAETAWSEATRRCDLIGKELAVAREAARAAAEIAAWQASDRLEQRYLDEVAALANELRAPAARVVAVVRAMEEFRVGLPVGGSDPPMGWNVASLWQLVQVELSRATNGVIPSPGSVLATRDMDLLSTARSLAGSMSSRRPAHVPKSKGPQR